MNHEAPSYEMPEIYEGQYVATPKGDGYITECHKDKVTVLLAQGYYRGHQTTVTPK